MSRRFPVLCAAAVLLLRSSAPCSPIRPDVMTLSKPKVFGSLSRAPVRFTHKDHMSLEGVSCLTCHHDFKDGKNVLDPKAQCGGPVDACAACHTDPIAAEGVSRAVHHLPRHGKARAG